jgi:catechol 2,3-dioxygenase-like lactoylglutathione lyase family enzyme
MIDARNGGTGMRTLHVGLRVTDLARSLAFYTAIGYEVVGSVPSSGQQATPTASPPPTGQRKGNEDG